MFCLLSAGRDRFYSNIEAMLGFPINPWCGWCWKYLSPIFCLVSTGWLSLSFVFKPQTKQRKGKKEGVMDERTRDVPS